MADVKMPRTFKVGAKATEAARAQRDPSLKAPENAKVRVDKNGVEYKTWVETGTIEFAYREATGDGSQTVHIIGLKPRPGEPNFGKLAFLRMKVHPDIAEGREVDAETQRKFGWLTEKALVALVALIDVTGFAPKAGDGLSGQLLETLFPLAAQKTKGHLIGKVVAAKITQKKNLPPFNEKYPTQEDVDLFLPPPPVAVASGGLKK